MAATIVKKVRALEAVAALADEPAADKDSFVLAGVDALEHDGEYLKAFGRGSGRFGGGSFVR